MELKELVEKHKDVMLEAAEAYLNALKELNSQADEIDVITAILKGMEYEHHEGQVMPNSPDISVHHFISKDDKYIIQLVLSEADKEAIASIRQDDGEYCGVTKTDGEETHECLLEKGHEGEHTCGCGHAWSD